MFNPFLVLDNFISLVGRCHRLRGAQQPTKCSRSQCESCCRGRVAVESSASNEGYPKVRNHGEGPYKGLLLVESGYYRFHI